MRRKGRPKKQKSSKVIKAPGKRGRPKVKEVSGCEPPQKKAKRGRPKTIKVEQELQDVIDGGDNDPLQLSSAQVQSHSSSSSVAPDENYSEGLHMSTMQVRALSSLVACLECGEEVVLGVRPTTKGMISEFTVSCRVCGSNKSTNTPNLIRERKRKREKKGVILQKNENINYAHVASFLDNGLGYSGLRHYCKYFNARCLNEATFIVYARQVISDVVHETEDFLQQNARIVRKAFESQLDNDYIFDLTVGYTTTYHQWGSDFCLVAGAVIELQTGLVLDYDVGNMYCHVCKINAKKIVSMSPAEMTEWFNKHQDTCEIREWCDEIDQDSEEGIKEIDPKYLEAFIAKKIWARSLEKFGFRYTTLIHESDERIHSELLKAAPYGDIPVIIDNITNCFSRRKSEHARTSFQNKLKSKCPRERVQTKDRIMYVYAMSIPEYNKFAIGSNIKLRELVRRMEIEEEEYANELTIQAAEIIPAIREQEMIEDKGMVMKDVGDAFEMERGDESDEEPDEIDDEDEEELQELNSLEDTEVLDDDEEEIAINVAQQQLSAEKSATDKRDGNVAKSKETQEKSSIESSTKQEKHLVPADKKHAQIRAEDVASVKKKNISGANTREKSLTVKSEKKSEAGSKVLPSDSAKPKAARDPKIGSKVVATEETVTEIVNTSSASTADRGSAVAITESTSGSSNMTVKADSLVKKQAMTEQQHTKAVTVASSELKQAIPSSDNRKTVIDEKSVLVEKKDLKTQKVALESKASHLQSQDDSGTSKGKETSQINSHSENGRDDSKCKEGKEPEILKPFRVEFDDD